MRSLLASSLLLGLLGAPRLTLAAGPTQIPVTETDPLKLAREQFAQALALQTGGDWAGALALLKEVASVKPTPQVRFNIALCEERLGRLVAALGDYQLAGADAHAQKSDLVEKEVGTRLESLKARLPQLIVRRGPGAEAATISVDGVTLGDSVLNAPLPADPGPHRVEASAPGYLPFRQSFRLAERQTQTIEVILELRPIQAEPLVAVQERAAPSGLRNAGYVVGGAGIASLIASGAMFYLRQTAIHDLDQQCGDNRANCPDSARSMADRGQLYTTLGNVTLAVGVVGLGVGAALVIVGGHSKEQAKLALAPGASGADSGGMSLVGKF